MKTINNRKHFVKIKHFSITHEEKSMEFLPEDYKAPIGVSRYMKLKDGENRLRILSKPVLGWEDWDNKIPVRYRMKKGEKAPEPINPNKPVKHFWAFIVWNYQDQKIQILSITQATVMKALDVFSKDPDWGAPYFYDIKIYKTGKDKETKYSVTPLPHKELSRNVEVEFHASPCNLDALFENEDPFSSHFGKYTPGVFQNSENENIEIA